MKIATHEAAVDIVHRCVERCGLCLELIGLARLRVSQVHGCDERADAHFLSLIDADFPLEKLVLVADWRNAGAELQPQEQAVLAWAEALVDPDRTPVPDALYQEVFAMLGHEELVGLSLAIALENALSRPRPRSPPGRPSFATAPPRKDPTMTTLAPLATPSAGLLAPYSGSEMLALYTTTVAVSGGAARHARDDDGGDRKKDAVAEGHRHRGHRDVRPRPCRRPLPHHGRSRREPARDGRGRCRGARGGDREGLPLRKDGARGNAVDHPARLSAMGGQVWRLVTCGQHGGPSCMATGLRRPILRFLHRTNEGKKP
jgi:hypothetical protein